MKHGTNVPIDKGGQTTTTRAGMPAPKGGYMPGKQNKKHHYSMKKSETPGEHLAYILLVLAQWACVALRIWVMTVLYKWFAVPLGAPEIHWAYVYALSLLVRFMAIDGDNSANYATKEYDTEIDQQSTKLLVAVAYPLLALGIAAMWHYFIVS